MTSEAARAQEPGAVPDLAALTKVIARQRAELDRLQDMAAASVVLERAKGAVMARTGCSPEAAHEGLQQRAKEAGRTLLEECWITLGGLGPPGRTAAQSPLDDEVAHRPPRPAALPAGSDGEDLARLGRALVRVGGPQDLARCLLDHLPPDVGADAVLIFARLTFGGLELVGHAGVDDLLVQQWSRVPPVSGIAALDALDAGEARWLEDIRVDRQRYLLIGNPADQWMSRAWLPVATGQSADVVVGIFRHHEGPFTAEVRRHLLAAARLCAGVLRMSGIRQNPTVGAATDALRTVFDRLPGTAVLLTPLRGPSGDVEDFRVDAATADTSDALGRSGRELVGMRFLDCWPMTPEEPLWQGCLGTLVSGRPYESEPFAQQHFVDGISELSTYSARVARLGDGLVVNWVRHDPSDRQEQRLADVQRLGNLGWANWNLLTGEVNWSSQVFAIFGRDPAEGAVALGQLPDLALPEDKPAVARAVAELMGQGRPCDVPFRLVTREGIRHLRAVAEAVPDDRGTPVEVHGFVQDVTAQRSAELALIASERAVLTQHGVLQAERTVAARLQDALLPLPRQPVRLAGLRVDIAYLPAQSGLNVGGDWFSAIELPDGDALFVVGDVAGHGIDAVAAMALLRFTAKGMVITGSSLTGALVRLNALLLHSRDPHGTATMVLARYTPRERRLVWAQAGHPPPLLLRDGKARYLDRPFGMLLGAGDSARYEEAECRLAPGDRLVLYTDGLVERPSESIDRGLERLARAAAVPGAGGSAPLDRLLGALLEPERRDDVCVLDIRVPVEGEEPAQ
ncbi:SpoIIE family protein phosphatase [Streptomyces phaeoluteigriseus]|uniref:SpoIIE family protein phosphatase n=1 Tax=Streptomyces phaeoluteigriseus TaxID=114686 RepID=A0ABY4Z7R3_9ACTN|nr:SpoIIE family protein phosphatase [Streptomyces phaeoluteigriseus]USQ84902.1 SpoIIE family protein phosphatase [Streptomyces phaeoluteigriseus]